MDSEFKPPQNEEEFKTRAKGITAEGARAIIKSLRSRREAVVKSLDEELKFYKRVLDQLGEEY